MPFRIACEDGVIEIDAVLTPDELPAFRKALDAEIRRMPGTPRNWLPLFMALIGTMQASQGLNHEKIAAIKLWRMVSRVGLKDAKDYVEGVAAKLIAEPNGNEFPDLMFDADSERDRDWFERMNRRFGTWPV